MDIGDLTERQNEPSAANRASDVHELLIGIQILRIGMHNIWKCLEVIKN